MKMRAFVMLGLATVLAGLAVVAAQQWVHRPTPAVAQANTTPVVIASLRFGFGAPIVKEQLRVVQWPTASVPAGSFHAIDEVVSKDSKRVALQPIEIDEPILKSKVSGFGGRASLSAVIGEPMRAATIRVNDVNGVAGFVLPGDRVDVLLTRDRTAARMNTRKNAGLETDILLQNVKVLAIDQDADKKKDTPSVAKAVTLEVDPTDAQKLVLAQQVGTLSLALRNSSNSAAVNSRTVRLSDLGPDEVESEPVQTSTPVVTKRAPAPERRPSITVYRGIDAYDYEVTGEGSTRLLSAPPANGRLSGPSTKPAPNKTRPTPSTTSSRSSHLERGAQIKEPAHPADEQQIAASIQQH